MKVAFVQTEGGFWLSDYTVTMRILLWMGTSVCLLHPLENRYGICEGECRNRTLSYIMVNV